VRDDSKLLYLRQSSGESGKYAHIIHYLEAKLKRGVCYRGEIIETAAGIQQLAPGQSSVPLLRGF
jgi:hypothetical protein